MFGTRPLHSKREREREREREKVAVQIEAVFSLILLWIRAISVLLGHDRDPAILRIPGTFETPLETPGCNPVPVSNGTPGNSRAMKPREIPGTTGNFPAEAELFVGGEIHVPGRERDPGASLRNPTMYFRHNVTSFFSIIFKTNCHSITKLWHSLIETSP